MTEEDEARELAYILAQTPPSRIARNFLTTPSNSLQTRFQTPSSPSHSQELYPSIPKQSPVIKNHRSIHTPPPFPPARQPSGLVPPSPILSTPVVKIRRSPALSRSNLSDEAAFWVVTSGAYPGVYEGKYIIIFFFFNLC
jgi:hypothetical protein